jgi:hypothetical protein
MGDGVNIAARLEGIAKPGGICVSEDAYRQVRDRVKEAFFDLGERDLKNIAHPVRVYVVMTGSTSLAPASHPSAPDKASPPRLSIVALDPTFTVSRFRKGALSSNPTYLALRERIYEGMRKTGVPEG